MLYRKQRNEEATGRGCRIKGKRSIIFEDEISNTMLYPDGKDPVEREEQIGKWRWIHCTIKRV